MDRTQHYQQVMSADTLTGDRVRNAAGEDLGKIEDFMFDMDSGHINYAVLSFSGVRGARDKLFAVPPQALRIDKGNKCLVLNVDKDRLEHAPGFDRDRWPAAGDRTFDQDVYQYYGQKPYWDGGNVSTASSAGSASRSAYTGNGGRAYIKGEHEHEHGEQAQQGHRRSAMSLLRQLVNDVAVLFRKELALAASEINESINDTKKGVGSIAGGAGVLFAGLLFLLLAATAALALVVPVWAAALIVGSAVALIGWVMVQSGKKKLEPSSFAPERTAKSLRKDQEAVRRHT